MNKIDLEIESLLESVLIESKDNGAIPILNTICSKIKDLELRENLLDFVLTDDGTVYLMVYVANGKRKNFDINGFNQKINNASDSSIKDSVKKAYGYFKIIYKNSELSKLNIPAVFSMHGFEDVEGYYFKL